MRSDDLVMFCYCDLSGIVRGRAFPAADLAERLRSGVGWVPADQAITPLGPIAEPNPWGPLGDLRLLPDPSTELHLDLWEDAGPLHLFLCDAVHPDGAPWDSCVRTFLKDAIAELERHGVRLVVAFEQEFHLAGGDGTPPPGFSVEAFRGAEPFASTLTRALVAAGQEPETVLPEYGANQFEVTLRPRPALVAADRAALVREIVREVARRVGRRASFAPIVDPADVGNGVHVHFSLTDLEGRPITRDPDRPGQVGEAAGHFVAGVVRHLPALCAVTAPSVVSYHRLTPHRWSAAYTCWGERNREAAIRIAPVPTLGGGDPDRQFNLEYRPADAAASPHLALGAVLRAGIAGLAEELEPPELVQTDPNDLDDDERRRLGIRRLPESLEEALAALEADDVARSWFSPALWEAFRSMKRSEIEDLAGADPQAACDRYRNAY